MGTEGVLRDAGVEGVGGQVVAAADEHELIRRNDQVQETGLGADRAVAVRHLEPCGRRDFEANPAAVASTRMLNHELAPLPRAATFTSGERVGVKEMLRRENSFAYQCLRSWAARSSTNESKRSGEPAERTSATYLPLTTNVGTPSMR